MVTYLVSTQSGVQGVYSASGSSVEQLSYSLYGVPTIAVRTSVTSFSFQVSYSDPVGPLCLIGLAAGSQLSFGYASVLKSLRSGASELTTLNAIKASGWDGTGHGL